eukprot:2610571-Ditylum_brightwellii.AAC.1
MMVDSAEVRYMHDLEMDDGGDHITTGRVKRRVLGSTGRTAGSYHDIPIQNSTVYEVEFPEGEVNAKNMLMQVDFEGFTTTMMEEIIDHDG